MWDCLVLFFNMGPDPILIRLSLILRSLIRASPSLNPALIIYFLFPTEKKHWTEWKRQAFNYKSFTGRKGIYSHTIAIGMIDGTPDCSRTFWTRDWLKKHYRWYTRYMQLHISYSIGRCMHMFANYIVILYITIEKIDGI